jgi:lipoprotein-releasing system permease protein
MNGFRAELFDKIVGLNGHAVVQGVGGRLPDWRDIVTLMTMTSAATPSMTATRLIEATRKMNASPLPGSR